MKTGRKMFLSFCFVGLLVIIANIPNKIQKAKDQPAETGSKIYKDKLIPDQILEVLPPNPSIPGDKLLIMAGVDGDHLVSITIEPYEVYEGSTPIIFYDFSASNGRDAHYIHSPKKFDTQARFTITALDRKRKVATVTLSAHLVSTDTDNRTYLDIPPVTLNITGKQFDNLIKTKK